MPFAKNPVDGKRTYFEENGGTGPPILLYAGLTQPLQWLRDSELLRRLSGRFRLIYADHRGHGKSDKPHDQDAYNLATRVADAESVLDELGIEKAHFIGFSWGARLGFAVGEHISDRVLSLVLCGNQPYEWNPHWEIVKQVSNALLSPNRDGMAGFIERWENSLGKSFPEPERSFTVNNDLEAIRAAWQSAMGEGPISNDLRKWETRCLLYTGELDDMRDNARRAASEIPKAAFLSIPGETHISAAHEVDIVLPHVLELLTDMR